MDALCLNNLSKQFGRIQKYLCKLSPIQNEKVYIP